MGNIIRKKVRMIAAVMLGVLLLSTTAQAARITTPERSLSKDTYGNASQAINTAWGKKTFKMYYQGASTEKFIRKAGCGFCGASVALATLKSKYKYVTPEYMHNVLEKKTFGNKGKSGLTIYGEYRILKKAGLKCQYMKTFNRKTIGDKIMKHLYKGKPVLIAVSAVNQVTHKKDQKWAVVGHTLLLLGVTDTGKVIVYDSNNRGWNNRSQRIKLADMNELKNYLVAVKGSPSTRFTSMKRCGGIALIG